MKFLISILGWVPFLGVSLKMTYISSRALEVVNSVKVDNSKAELHGGELEKHISDMSKDAYEEHLKPEVDELGLPDFLTNKASEKAIDIISKKLKEKYIQKTS
jgi:transcriptional accessory protein Tex/SPT6